MPKQLVNVEKAKADFIAFCRSKYNESSTFLKQIDEFEADYREEDAIKFYTRPCHFVNYVISSTCAAFSVTNYFQIRFILHDLYLQMQRLHDEQSSMWPETLVVHRGKVISRTELKQLPKKNEYVITRDFLSVTTDSQVAETFSSFDVPLNDNNKVSVFISMHIDHEEVASKPIVFINDSSTITDEEEVLLPMGIVFRITSCEKVDDPNSQCSVRINMIRSKEEKEIEKKLSVSSPLVLGAIATAVGGIGVGVGIVGLLNFLEDKEDQEDQEDQEKFFEAITDAYESPDPDLAAEIQGLIDHNADSAAMVS
ncbi:unnamed protein product [Adineta steineri]|uniref:NAD(+)--protein-arginine ADP-ribosyltransferase n=1 Tax=Adineta steineri TaxID=433720 RepID=A0A813TP67_9BILA|nr:unnamed protein product [Adineta steineri]CAF0785383.1 unnamed protein product [Adineta steineri]CAF0811086.1 unnamed protein product [Adineta steineri]